MINRLLNISHISLTALLLCASLHSFAAAAPPDKSFSVRKGGTLQVSMDNGSIRIFTWNKDEVSVHIRADDDSNFRMDAEGNTVRIVDDGGWSDDAEIDVTVPAQFNLDLDANAGDISIRGDIQGNVYVRTGGGDIALAGVTGAVDVNTSGGEIDAGSLQGKAQLSTSGGNIDVRAGSDLALRTSGGNISVGTIARALVAKTSGGDIDLGDIAGEISVSTSGGNITMRNGKGQLALSTSGGNIDIRSASGEIRATTSGGDITTGRIEGSIEGRTAGGEIRVELIPSGNGRTRLTSAQGNIDIALPEAAKVTVDARVRVDRGWGSWGDRKDKFSIHSAFKEEPASDKNDRDDIRRRYVLNGGGNTIILETVNSDIEIRKLLK